MVTSEVGPLYNCTLQRHAKSCAFRPILSYDTNKKSIHDQSTSIGKVRRDWGLESPRAGTPQGIYFNDRVLLYFEQIQCNSAADNFAVNGCVCIPKRREDYCLVAVEEYLTSHYYLPSMYCCKLLENRLYT